MILNRVKAKLQKKIFKPFLNDTRTGLTLVEIIIVIALIGTLMGILVTTISSTSDEARKDECRIQMGVIGNALNMYRVHNIRYPTTAQGLKALVQDPGDAKGWRGPYIEEKKLIDPFNHEFEYESDGQKYKIRSKSMNESDPSDDIVYPEESNTQKQN